MPKFIATIKEPKGVEGSILLSNVINGLKGIRTGSEIYIGFSENFAKKFVVDSFKKRFDKYYLKIKNINNPERASEFKDQAVFANEADIEMIEELYPVEDLIGCSVIDVKSKKNIGTIKDVLILPGNDVWIVELPDGELPVPVIHDVIKNVDINSKSIDINIIPGLMDLKSTKKKSAKRKVLDAN